MGWREEAEAYTHTYMREIAKLVREARTNQELREEIFSSNVVDCARARRIKERCEPLKTTLKTAKDTQRAVARELEKRAKELNHIPCLYLPHAGGAQKIILYFHNDKLDLGRVHEQLAVLGEKLQMHVLAIEWPGYGTYNVLDRNEASINNDGQMMYDYLYQCLGINENDIILMGNQCGIQPCLHIASTNNPAAVIFMNGDMTKEDQAASIESAK